MNNTREEIPEQEWIRIIFTLHGSRTEYKDAVYHIMEDAASIRKILYPLGFTDEDFGTINISIEQDSVRVHGARRDWGYAYTHRMRLEFKNDQERLNKLLYVLADCPLNPTFEVDYVASKNEKHGDRHHTAWR